MSASQIITLLFKPQKGFFGQNHYGSRYSYVGKKGVRSLFTQELTTVCTTNTYSYVIFCLSSLSYVASPKIHFLPCYVCTYPTVVHSTFYIHQIHLVYVFDYCIQFFSSTVVVYSVSLLDAYMYFVHGSRRLLFWLLYRSNFRQQY